MVSRLEVACLLMFDGNCYIKMSWQIESFLSKRIIHFKLTVVIQLFNEHDSFANLKYNTSICQLVLLFQHVELHCFTIFTNEKHLYKIKLLCYETDYLYLS